MDRDLTSPPQPSSFYANGWIRPEYVGKLLPSPQPEGTGPCPPHEGFSHREISFENSHPNFLQDGSSLSDSSASFRGPCSLGVSSDESHFSPECGDSLFGIRNISAGYFYTEAFASKADNRDTPSFPGGAVEKHWCKPNDSLHSSTWLQAKLPVNTVPKYTPSRAASTVWKRSAVGNRWRSSRHAFFRRLFKSRVDLRPSRRLLLAGAGGIKVVNVVLRAEIPASDSAAVPEQVRAIRAKNPFRNGEGGQSLTSPKRLDVVRGPKERVLSRSVAPGSEKVLLLPVAGTSLPNERFTVGPSVGTMVIHEAVESTHSCPQGIGNQDFLLPGRCAVDAQRPCHSDDSSPSDISAFSGLGISALPQQVCADANSGNQAPGNGVRHQSLAHANSFGQDHRIAQQAEAILGEKSVQEIDAARSGSNPGVSHFGFGRSAANEAAHPSSSEAEKRVLQSVSRELEIFGYPDCASDPGNRNLVDSGASMVWKINQATEGAADGDIGRLGLRLGSSFLGRQRERTPDERVLWQTREMLFLQREGTARSNLGNTGVSQTESQDSICLVRQFVSSLPPEQAGRSSVELIKDGGEILALGIVPHGAAPSLRKVPAWSVQRGGGQAFEATHRQKRLETRTEVVSNVSDSDAESLPSGSFRDQNQQADRLVFDFGAGSRGVASRRLFSELATFGAETRQPVREPAVFTDNESPIESEGRSGPIVLSRPRMALGSLVAITSRTRGFDLSDDDDSFEDPERIPPRIKRQRINGGPRTLELDSVKGLWSLAGADAQTDKFLAEAVGEATIARVTNVVNQVVVPWARHCNLDVMFLSLEDSIKCLRDLCATMTFYQFTHSRNFLGRSLAFRRICEKFSDLPEVKLIANRMNQLNPSVPKLSGDIFDAKRVFDYIRSTGNVFERHIDLQFKVVCFLLQYSLMGRGSDVHRLTVESVIRDTSFDWFREFSPDFWSACSTHPNLFSSDMYPVELFLFTYPRKQIRRGATANRFNSRQIVRLYPALQRNSHREVCPVFNFAVWWFKVRHTRVHNPHLPLLWVTDGSKNSISRDWIANSAVALMTLAGIDTARFTNHSIKRTAISSAISHGMPAEETALISNTDIKTVMAWYAKHTSIRSTSGKTSTERFAL